MKNFAKISILAIYLVAALPAFAFADDTHPATMTFSPSSGSVAVNSNFKVDVVINTNGTSRTSGADIVVTFDPAKLEYVSATRPATNDFYWTPGDVNHEDSFVTRDTDKLAGTVDIGHSVKPGTLPNAYPTGTGNVATLTFKTLAPINSTVALTLGFTSLGATTDSNVISSTSTDILSAGSSATFTVAEAEVLPTTPTITSISPTHGSKNLAQSVTITGTNFGVEGADSKVYIGTKLAVITSWSDTRIVIDIESEPDLSEASTRQIKVHRNDGEEATFVGYTYDMLPHSGPEMLPFLGLAMSAFGMAGLTYTKLATRKSVQVEDTTDSTSNLAI